MSDKTHTERCEGLQREGRAMADIATVLKERCENTGQARRVLVAAGLVSGVMDIDDECRIFYVREPGVETIKVL